MNRHFAQWMIVPILISSSQAALDAETSPEPPPGSMSVNVRVYNYARVAEGTLERAKQTAAHIFRQAGVQTNWFDCRLAHADPPKDPECAQPRRASDLVLRVLPESMAKRMGLPPTHFGFAPLATKGRGASHASVFFHKVEELARGQVTLHAVLLGHIMAHEIGHLLLGSNSHSRRGVMRAQWRDSELRHAVDGKFLFTPGQRRQMRERRDPN